LIYVEHLIYVVPLSFTDPGIFYTKSYYGSSSGTGPSASDHFE